MSANLDKLKTLLAELFMLDQADLDFGIYRVMNAKRVEVTRFLENDLLPQVRATLATVDTGDRAALETEKAKAIAAAQGIGLSREQAEQTPKVRELQAKLDAHANPADLENEVLSDLANFFRRYYQDGDFLALRRYKAGVYAIPYEGEEVKLHWANADQYYIKTSEYLRDYTFKLADGKRVHFKLVEADTEADNKKAAAGQERRFILCAADPLVETDGELVIRFEYRPDADKRKQAELNTLAAESVFNASGFTNWKAALAAKAPTEKNPNRTLLDKHLSDYTARNSFDYFIHKDIGGFLRRELDFFIKNEIMHLDDIEAEQAPRVEQYLAKIKAIRAIARKIIAFLEQLENFQKKLWLKKKFVVETNYCVTLNRVPESLYPEIVEGDAGEAQRAEWVRLFAIDEIQADLAKPGYSKPLTVAFLKANPFLVLDTKFFSTEFKEKLLASEQILDSAATLDDAINGLLVQGENFQMLNLLKDRFHREVKCLYIDPPYNTGSDGFPYKDSYQHSSWLAMMRDRLTCALEFLSPDGVLYVSIGEEEVTALQSLLDQIFGSGNRVGTIVWKARVKPVNIGDAKYRPQNETEYVVGYEREDNKARFLPLITGGLRTYPHEFNGRKYRLTTILKSNRGTNYRSTMSFELEGYTPPEGQRWQAGEDEIRWLWDNNYIEFNEGVPSRRYFEDEEGAEHDPFYCFMDQDWSGTSEGGKSELNHLLGNTHGFDTVKPKRLIVSLLTASAPKNSYVLDFFGGSGTTGHAVIAQNRDDADGKRKYILAEMGEYFDSLMKPRIQKVIYSKDWREGKPVSREGSSNLFKYIRLESYEDALNNLELKRTEAQDDLLREHAPLREDYLLRYQLDVETRDSASLLKVAQFTNPFAYQLKIATGSVGESRPVNVDLVETFNYLLGLRVGHMDTIRGFKVVTGLNPAGEKTLVIWRNVAEKSNADLDAFFQKQGYNTKDMEFAVIYVNGDNNLENLKRGDETWKVRRIEDEFKRLMFDVQDV